MKIRLILIWVLSIVVLNAGEYIIKNSKYSVDKTIKNIEKIVKSKGMNVFGIIDHKANAQKVGYDMLEAKVIIFGNPKMGTRIMLRDIRAAIDLPIRILVYKDYNDQVKIEYLNPDILKKRFKLQGCAVIPKMKNVLDQITTKAGN